MKKSRLWLLIIASALILSGIGAYISIEKVLLPKYWTSVSDMFQERGYELSAEKLHWVLPAKVEIENLSLSDEKDRVSVQVSLMELHLNPFTGDAKILEFIELPQLIAKIGQIDFSEIVVELNQFQNWRFSFDGYFLNDDNPQFILISSETESRFSMKESGFFVQSNGDLKEIDQEMFPYKINSLDYELEFNLPFPVTEDISVSSSIVINEAEMDYSLISRSPILWEDISWQGDIKVEGKSFDKLNAEIHTENFSIGEVPGKIDLSYQTSEEGMLIEGVASIAETAIQDIVDSLPNSLLGSLEGIEMEGYFSWNGSLYFPLNDIKQASLISEPTVRDLIVKKIPDKVNVFKVDAPFIHKFETPDGDRYIQIPEDQEVSLEWMLAVSEQTPGQVRYWRNYTKNNRVENPDVFEPVYENIQGDDSFRFVRLDEMTQWIPKAVLTGEDGDFFFHNGINWLTYRHALERNFETGEVQLGASTISMQLIKNLFLSQEQTIVRKIQEAFLVYLAEMQVPLLKERILEIYLNIAEFGPGIFGIDQASRHFFGKDPNEINISEAVYLTSILPGPHPFYEIFESGAIDDEWFSHMGYYFDIMIERGRINREQYLEVIQEPPLFKID